MTYRQQQVVELLRRMAEHPTPAMRHCGLHALAMARANEWCDEELVCAVFAMMAGGAAYEVECETFSVHDA